MDEIINTSQTVPNDLGGGENDDTVELKDVLGQALSREFKTNEEALESVKQTSGYVGKVGKFLPLIEKLQGHLGGESNVLRFMEDTLQKSNVQEVKTPEPTQTQPKVEDFISREQYENDTFFSKNPQFEPYKELLSSLKQTTGKPLSEVAASDTFKSVFEKASKADEMEKGKSVLHSNARLGSVSDKISQAREHLKQGNDADAKNAAVAAVIDAYGLRG